MILLCFLEVKRDSKSAVARLLLVVQEAHDLMPSTATLDRHRRKNMSLSREMHSASSRFSRSLL